MNKFIPEIPEDLRYEELSTRRLVVPEGFERPETTEEMINRLLNGRLSSVDNSLDDGDSVDDFSLDDDDDGDFPDDFFDSEPPFELVGDEDSKPSPISPETEPDVEPSEDPSAGSSAE